LAVLDCSLRLFGVQRSGKLWSKTTINPKSMKNGAEIHENQEKVRSGMLRAASGAQVASKTALGGHTFEKRVPFLQKSKILGAILGPSGF
jgi:hypothetical protein